MPKSKAAAEREAWVNWTLEDMQPILFKGMLMRSGTGTHGYAPMGRRELADRIFQKDFSVAGSTVDQVLDILQSVAPDWSGKSHLIGFHDRVWDMKKLAFVDDQYDYVYSSAIAPNDDPEQVAKVWEYLLKLSSGDEELARDYLQLAAPLFMEKRPVGVIWVTGAGANGKSAYLDAWEAIIGKHFGHLTVEMIEDGRATPSLRGILGNVVSETSEKRVEDMQRYKNMGAHEPFQVRLLGHHEVITVDTNFHTIFSANNIPAFADKTMGSRRRTLLVPFPATFADDPHFKERTFTKEFLGALLHLTLEEAKRIGREGYVWSEASNTAQNRYNQDANTAEAFVKHVDELGIIAFKNYQFMKFQYETWCATRGLVPLGRTQLKRAIEDAMKPVEIMVKDENGVTARRFFTAGITGDEVVWFDNGYGYRKPDEKKVDAQLRLDEKQRREW